MESQYTYEVRVKPSYFECDFRRQWKLTQIFQRLSETALEHADISGFGGNKFYDKGLMWVLSRVKVQMSEYPMAGTDLIVRTWPKTIQQKLFFIRDFEILTLDGKKIGSSSSAWLIVDAQERKLIPPARTGLNFPMIPDKHGIDETLEKITAVECDEPVSQVKVGYTSLDLYSHVNNSRYIDWVCDAFEFEQYQKQKIQSIQINYDHELKAGDLVEILRNKDAGDANKYQVSGRKTGEAQNAFSALVEWRNWE